MKYSIHLITILIPIIAILSLSGCGSGSSESPVQVETSKEYSPPQPAVTNDEERPPAVPTI